MARTCEECNQTIPKDLRHGTRFCSVQCQQKSYRKATVGFDRNPALDDPAFFTSKHDPFEARRKRRAQEWADGKSHPEELDYPDLPDFLKR